VPSAPRRLPWTLLGAGFVLAAGVLAALHHARGLDYWNYSEGVYAFTSRLLKDGDDVYGSVVAAQPPWQFLFGAAVLAIEDSIGFLRTAVGLVQVATGLLGALAVWRLTGNRAATVIAPALTLLTPWAVHEHGHLTPELIVPPLLLGAALASTSARWTPLAAVLAAMAPFVKVPFLLAVVVVVLLAPERRRAAVWAAGALVVQAALFTAVFGTGLWDHTVIAQLDSGRRGLGVLGGVGAQAVWNLAALLVLAAAALVFRARLADEPLLRSLIAMGLAALLTVTTVGKEGTSLNVMVPVEAVLLPLALAGAVALVRARPGTVATAAVAAAAVFIAVQTASLFTTSPTGFPFVYPLSDRGAWGQTLTEAQVREQVATAQSCPPGVAFSGPPYIAFLAGRDMPADQPDQFLPAQSEHLADVFARMQAGPRCP